jgi:hypothetical protein
MTRNLDIPKASAESAARAILDGVERGDEEIFPDPMSGAIAEGWRSSAVKALERQFAAYVQETPVKSQAWQTIMNEQYPTAEFLVICRGEWDSTLLQKEKQNVIDQFYAWFDELVDQGKIKRGQRLTSQGNTIGEKGAITDGPFGESKEVIGGYLVRSRSKSGRGGAHRQRRPCLDHSKLVEIRPIDSGADTHGSWRNELASADNTSQ